ncbi:MAG: hypothetical protein COX43_02395 [Parcubacteria group bacterium CG23_combo_of_CG06-09_8_20_14_all_35_9]|nr:MAG: hypothetical protein COX43_02395 [Parcubacteria group bacterium CG23_combo_of_CG06-09_8_20_14_all_35_9]
MSLLTTVAILIAGFFIWFFISTVWAFFKYKNKERMDKNEIGSYLSEGLSLSKALEKVFSSLNKYYNLGLRTSTVEQVSNGIAELEKTMDTSNVVEIYSTFIYRYVFRNGKNKKPTNISDQKIIYALETLDFNERNGYFVIKPDKDEDFDKKYPD